MSEFSRHVLECTGQTPVAFNGVLIAECGEPESLGPYTRWHEMRIYAIDSKKYKYVLELVYRSNASNSHKERIEADQHDVFLCETAKSVEEELRNYDEMEFVVGFPKGVTGWEEKMRKLKESIRANFESKLGKLLIAASQYDSDFIETVE